MKTYLAYHLEHVRGPFEGLDFFTDIPVEKGAQCFVVSAKKPIKTGKVVYQLEGKYRIVDFGTNKSGRYPDKDWHLKLSTLICPSTPIALDKQADFDREIFHKNFTSGSGIREMTNQNGAFPRFFDALLGAGDDSFDIELLEDLEEIDEDADPTEREEMRKARIGQGKFRRNAVATWGGTERCAVTGIAIPALLNASHIIPWREDVGQRMSGCNGILLAAHLDRLFDRCLIGFQQTSIPDVLALVSAPSLKREFAELAAIGITARTVLDLTMVKFSDRPKLDANLHWHLDRVFANS